MRAGTGPLGGKAAREALVYALPWSWKERLSSRTPLHLIASDTADEAEEATCVRCGERIALPEVDGPLPPYSYATDPDDWELFGSLSEYRRCTAQ